MNDNTVKLGKQYTLSRTAGANTLELEDVVYKDIIKTLCTNGVLLIDWYMSPTDIECSWLLEGVKQE